MKTGIIYKVRRGHRRGAWARGCANLLAAALHPQPHPLSALLHHEFAIRPGEFYSARFSGRFPARTKGRSSRTCTANLTAFPNGFPRLCSTIDLR